MPGFLDDACERRKTRSNLCRALSSENDQKASVFKLSFEKHLSSNAALQRVQTSPESLAPTGALSIELDRPGSRASVYTRRGRPFNHLSHLSTHLAFV